MFCSSSPNDLAETTSETWTFQFEPERTSCSLLRRACNSRKHKVSRAEVRCQQPGAAPLPGEELRTQQAGGCDEEPESPEGEADVCLPGESGRQGEEERQELSSASQT